MPISKTEEYLRVYELLAKTLIILIPLCLIFGGWCFKEWIKSWPEKNSHLVRGTVLREERFKLTPFIVRPKLYIQLKDEKTIVHAILSVDGGDMQGQKVTFYYTGDPSKEVFLQEEDNPLWVGVLTISILILVIFLRIWYKRKIEKHYTSEDS
jgi:hypothetical protein